MYEVVSRLLEMFSAMFQGYCLQYFYGSFLESRVRNRRINGLAAAALYGVLRLGEEVLASESGRAMLSNTDFVVMLNQSPSNAQQLSELYKITENQRTYFTNTQPGHGLMKIGGAMIPFISTVPTDTKLYRMLSTNPREGKWD